MRIFINGELDELRAGLQASEALLREGGILAVVSFHSLEDRIVKNFLTERGGRLPGPSRHRPELHASEPAAFDIPSRRPVLPSDKEISHNARARSAKLRVAIRRARHTDTASTDQGVK